MQESEVFWNELELEASDFPAIFSLATLRGPTGPKAVGTAFVVSAQENYAIAVTVAHNFDGLMQAQQPQRSHHPTALLELLGTAKEISLEPGQVSAIYSEGDNVWAANVDWVFVDKKRDLAILKISTNDGVNAFRSQFIPCEYAPKIGDDVLVMGYDMTIKELDSGEVRFTRRLISRVGKVREYYPEGHIFVRGACIETSIPVFGGMSGGPVFIRGEAGEPMCAIGAISSDPDDPDDIKNNPTYRGQSAITLLDCSDVSVDPENKAFTLSMISGYFQFSDAEGAKNPDLSLVKEKTCGFPN